MNLIAPEHIFFSNGKHKKYGHPHKEAIETARALQSVKKDVKAHHLSWTSSQRKHRSGKATKHSIFSTYDSGDLIAELHKGGTVRIRTQVDGDVGVVDEAKSDVEREEKSDAEVKEPMEQEQTASTETHQSQQPEQASKKRKTDEDTKKEGTKEEEEELEEQKQ